jgi:beta-lactamase regulating signal transducer with metallopeptidase domain
MNPLLHWLNAPEWTQLVAALLHSLWQGALLAILLAVLLRRLIQPRLRYYASLGTLGILVLAGIITWAVLTAPKTNAPVAPAPLAIEPPVVPAFASTFNLDSPDKIVAIGTPIPPAPPTVPWTAWLALVWMLGALAMLFRAGIKVAGAEKLRRSCQPLTDETMTLLVVEACRAINLARKIRVVVTDQLTSPAVVGILVPTLILPLSLFTTLTPEQIRFILLHELAHIRRGDYLANLFQLLAEALLFFNPAVWWLSHHIRREREACCDALAIELSGAPADYAKTLVRVAENTLPTAPTTALAFGEDGREPSSLADRVQRLLVPGYRPSLRLTWRAMLAAICVGGILLFLSAVGTRNVVGAVSSNLTGTATDPATNVTEIFSASGDLTNASFTSPKWDGSWNPKIEKQTSGGAAGMFYFPQDEEVLARLEQIKFDKVFYRNKNLTVVLSELEKALLASDPDKRGFRLTLPPDWAYPANRDGIESVVINMPFALRNTTMRDVLDAIVSSASSPIQYRLGGFSANFMMKFDAPTNMWFRRFNVYGKTFLPFIGVDESMAAASTERNGESPDQFGEAIRKRFLQAGVDLRPPNSVLYKPGADLLYVHAEKKEDLDAVEALLRNLSQEGGEARRKSPSQVSGDSKSSMPQLTLLKPTIQAISQVSSAVPRDLEISSSPTIGMPSSALSDYLVQDGFLGHPPTIGMANWVSVTNGHLKKAWFYSRIGKVGEMQPVPVRNTETPESSSSDQAMLSNTLNQITIPSPPLITQTFQVNPIGITTAAKDLTSKFPTLATTTNNPSAELRALLNILGVNLEPPKSLLYNQEGGALFVRATATDLKKIEEILQIIGTQPPQVHIKTLFVEADDDLTALLRDLVDGTNRSPNTAISLAATPSILSPEQLEALLKTLKENYNAEIMSAPRVTTLSGRQGQVQMVNMRTIATGITGVISNGVTNLVVQTDARPFGPILDVVPVVAADRISIQLTLMPSITEFVGYDQATAATFVPTPPSTNSLPLPIFRVRQITTSVVVRDGQTVLLSGFSDRMSRNTTGNKSVEKLLNNGRQMLVFVTPLIIDQAGNPANQDLDSASKQILPSRP